VRGDSVVEEDDDELQLQLTVRRCVVVDQFSFVQYKHLLLPDLQQAALS